MSTQHPLLASTRVLRYSLVILAGVGGVLLFMLTSASFNTALFETNYSALFVLNGLVALGLLALVCVLGARLYKRYRDGVFGSRLLLRMSLSFALMGLIPGLTLYIVSVQFLAKSIDSWFNVRVDSALESGLNLGRTVLDNQLQELSLKMRGVALDLAGQTDAGQVASVNRLREQLGVTDLTLFSSTGRVLASASTELRSPVPELPSQSQLKSIGLTRPQAELESAGNETDLTAKVIALVPENNYSLTAEQRYLLARQPVPKAIARQADAIQSVYRDYQQLSLSRTGLRQIYGVTLTLALLLTVFLAIVVAFWLSSRLAAPLLWLAEGTKAVTEGNFKPIEVISADGELRQLTESFNAMTVQLYEARTRLEAQQAELRKNNEFLEKLLGNLSAGVLVFDDHFRLRMYNDGAQRIFERKLQSLSLGPFDEQEAFAAFGTMIRAAFAHSEAMAMDGADNQDGVWQKQIEFERTDHHAAPRVLLVRGSRLPADSVGGYVVVCDDISPLISAQRTAAWGEVARRLAHEIKNPLTPIQLSAERLQMKLEPALQEPLLGILTKSTRTIVNQVAAMKHMVDDFREYARLPPAELRPLDVNELVQDVLGLYGHIEMDGQEAQQKVFARLAPGLPKIAGDATQLRQVVHNLLQNAHDAVAELPDKYVEIRTTPYATELGGPVTGVRLQVRDNGTGFPDDLLARAFEPYVTTKPKGTGLGLAIVRKIADEHQARIVLKNRKNEQGDTEGATVEMVFPVLKQGT